MLERPELRVSTSEQLLINACGEAEAARVLCASVGRGQCAESLAEAHPGSAVTCHCLDLYQAEETHTFQQERLPNLHVVCSADFPQEEYDLFVLPVIRGGEAELTRDWLQYGYDRLKVGGWLYTAVDNKKDKWLHHEVEKLSKGLVRRPKPRGMVYKVQKQEPLKRLRDFSAEFVFRDGEHLIKAVSRPGVFSHRKLDLGARALLEGITVEPGMKVLDIGCGSGTVGIAAAFRDAGVHVVSLDSNARAVQCTQLGGDLNGLGDRLEARLDADGSTVEPASFDLVVGNPPYFSHFKIADIFLRTANRALKKGGTVAMVTKRADWFVARMEQLFNGSPSVATHRGYDIVTTTR